MAESKIDVKDIRTKKRHYRGRNLSHRRFGGIEISFQPAENKIKLTGVYKHELHPETAIEMGEYLVRMAEERQDFREPLLPSQRRKQGRSWSGISVESDSGDITLLLGRDYRWSRGIAEDPSVSREITLTPLLARTIGDYLRSFGRQLIYSPR